MIDLIRHYAAVLQFRGSLGRDRVLAGSCEEDNVMACRPTRGTNAKPLSFTAIALFVMLFKMAHWAPWSITNFRLCLTRSSVFFQKSVQ